MGASPRASAAGSWSGSRRKSFSSWSLRNEARARRLVFRGHALDQRAHRQHLADAADALPGAPDIAPRLELVASLREAHFRLVRGGQVIRIEARAFHAVAQKVG